MKVCDGNSFNNSKFDEHTEEEAPPDRGSVVYLVMLLHGIGVLMSWNLFITARDYFVDYKFGGSCSEYSKNFLAYLGIASQVPNLLLNLCNVVAHHLVAHAGGSLTKRIVSSISVIVVVFIITMILAIIDTSAWPGTFFAITLLTVVIMQGAGGIYQNSIFGVAASLPMTYSNAVIIGNNISGTITSVILIITISVSPNLRTAAIYYFLVAVFVLLVCFDAYFLLPKCKFYRFHKRESERRQRVEDDMDRQSLLKDEVVYGGPTKGAMHHFLHNQRIIFRVLKEAWVQMWNIFFVFFVSLTIFPAMQADILPLSDTFKGMGQYFRPVTCFLLFNVFATIGSFIPRLTHWPGPKWIWIPVLVRGLMIPYFLFCNYRPTLRMLPVYIASDWAYIIMAIAMAVTSGYFSSLVMMYAPSVVPKAHAPIAGMMAAFFLILGINCGIGFSLVVGKIAENVGPLVPSFNVSNSC